MKKSILAMTSTLLFSTIAMAQIVDTISVPARRVSHTWNLISASMQVNCAKDPEQVRADGTVVLARAAMITVSLEDKRLGQKQISLPAALRVAVADGSAEEGSCKRLTQVFFDGLNGKTLAALYGTYTSEANGLSSSTGSFGSATNEHGVTILGIDGTLASNGWGDAAAKIVLMAPSDSKDISIEGLDGSGQKTNAEQTANLRDLLKLEIKK